MGNWNCREIGVVINGNNQRKHLIKVLTLYTGHLLKYCCIFSFRFICTYNTIQQRKRAVTIHQIIEHFGRINLVTILRVSCNEQIKACSSLAVTSIDQLQYRLTKLLALKIAWTTHITLTKENSNYSHNHQTMAYREWFAICKVCNIQFLQYNCKLCEI